MPPMQWQQQRRNQDLVGVVNFSAWDVCTRGTRELCARRRPERDWGRLAGGELVSWCWRWWHGRPSLTLPWNAVFSSIGSSSDYRHVHHQHHICSISTTDQPTGRPTTSSTSMECGFLLATRSSSDLQPDYLNMLTADTAPHLLLTN